MPSTPQKRKHVLKRERAKRRAAKARGKALEIMVRDDCNAIEGVKAWIEQSPSGSFGEPRTDVIVDIGPHYRFIIECKNRADWHIRKEVFEWYEQAEGDTERFDEIRWPLLAHCNSPGKGVKRIPMTLARWPYVLELFAKIAEREAYIADLEKRMEDLIDAI